MAEGLLRHMAGDRYEAHSAGLEPGQVHPLAVKTMAEVGIDITGQRSKSLQEYTGKMHFSFLIAVCSEADNRCPSTFPGVGTRIAWDISDPVAGLDLEEEELARFRNARDDITARLTAWLATQGEYDTIHGSAAHRL